MRRFSIIWSAAIIVALEAGPAAAGYDMFAGAVPIWQPSSPTSNEACQQLDIVYQETINSVVEAHDACLEENAHRQGRDSGHTCSVAICQTLHDRRGELSQTRVNAVGRCRADVRAYLAQEAEEKARQERRRVEFEQQSVERAARQQALRDRETAREAKRRELVDAKRLDDETLSLVEEQLQREQRDAELLMDVTDSAVEALSTSPSDVGPKVVEDSTRGVLDGLGLCKTCDLTRQAEHRRDTKERQKIIIQHEKINNTIRRMYEQDNQERALKEKARLGIE